MGKEVQSRPLLAKYLDSFLSVPAKKDLTQLAQEPQIIGNQYVLDPNMFPQEPYDELREKEKMFEEFMARQEAKKGVRKQRRRR